MKRKIVKSAIVPALVWLVIFNISSTLTLAQKNNNPEKKDVYVDQYGVMRWPDNQEVHGFGVNYTVPFAHAYRSAIKLGIDPKKAIDDDIYHFARLGFDAYRVHVWDTEISDTLGNLIENEHLELFDYMLDKMKQRGMKFILTPIAFWGNGWPDRDENTPGFSHKYGKDNCLTNEDAIKAQENYLFQFLNHVNQYTGIAYKNETAMIAFEISNEPHHREAPEKVTAYISRMVQSMRKTGCEKPIFYNISHSIHLAEAYFDAGIQGGTFQWYPTGLGFQKELKGNMLPNVDKYAIPFEDVIKRHQGAKMVYEFDAADIGRSYIYPAIARSFRTAGIQWATHFSYDPTYLAYANTEYNTHYMNLVYAPPKAISLKIAAEVFHQIPMGRNFGTFPGNATFDAFHVSYENDLAEMLTDEKFFYTNTTTTIPKDVNKLKEIAGFGNSTIIAYEGLGAYFLDQINKGEWRLEVLPDAIWIDNVFGRNSLGKTRVVINWREWPMAIHLPDLGENFTIKPLNSGNTKQSEVRGNQFSITPGTYLLTKSGIKSKKTGNEEWKNITLNEFVAPVTTIEQSELLHNPISEMEAGNDYKITATVVTRDVPKSVTVNILSGFRGKRYDMVKEAAYTYSVTVPKEEMNEGFLRYFIILNDGTGDYVFPGKHASQSERLDLSEAEPYEVKVLAKDQPIYLFDALTDYQYLNIPWRRGFKLMPKAEPGKAAYQVNIEKLFTDDAENPDGEKIYDFSMRFYFNDKIKGRANSINRMKELVLSGNSLNDKSCPIQVGLISKTGDVYGAIVQLDPESSEYKILLSELKPVKLVTLPRPYPSFLPYYFDGGSHTNFNIEDIEAIQISIGPGILTSQLKESHGAAIERVWLQ